MVHFVSHCGVTNAVYYSSQFSTAFPPLAAHTRGTSVLLDIRSGTVPNPGFPLWDLGVDDGESCKAPLEQPFTAVAHIKWGPRDIDFDALFFAPECLPRTFLIASFPDDIYPTIRSEFVSSRTQLPGAACGNSSSSGWREPPTSRWYVYFGCPVCGEYQRKHGIPILGDGNDTCAGTSFLVRPLELGQCPSCLVDQHRCRSTAPGLRLGE
jgi:hypothetical protein